MSTEQMRNAFEAWCALDNPRYHATDDSMANRRDWQVWQAALTQPAAPAPKDAESVMELVQKLEYSAASDGKHDEHPTAGTGEAYNAVESAVTALAQERDALEAKLATSLTDGWISVDERLPEPEAYVIAYNGKWLGLANYVPGLSCDEFDSSEHWQDEHREFIEQLGPKITHWRTLPIAPIAAKATPLTEDRFSVAKASGSRYAYVVDSLGERPPTRFNVLKGDGWAYADKLRDRLNAEHINAAAQGEVKS